MMSLFPTAVHDILNKVAGSVVIEHQIQEHAPKFWQFWHNLTFKDKMTKQQVKHEKKINLSKFQGVFLQPKS